MKKRNELVREIAFLKKELENAEEDVSNLTSFNKELIQKLKDAEAFPGERQLEDARTSNRDLRAQLLEQASENVRLQKRLDEEAGKNSALNKELSELKISYQNHLEVLRERNELAQKCSNLRFRINSNYGKDSLLVAENKRLREENLDLLSNLEMMRREKIMGFDPLDVAREGAGSPVANRAILDRAITSWLKPLDDQEKLFIAEEIIVQLDALVDRLKDKRQEELEDKGFLNKPSAKASADPVNHPTHYTSHPSGVECIQVTEHMNFNLGNAVKYLWRADLKGKALEDLKKAEFCVRREISRRSKNDVR